MNEYEDDLSSYGVRMKTNEIDGVDVDLLLGRFKSVGAFSGYNCVDRWHVRTETAALAVFRTAWSTLEEEENIEWDRFCYEDLQRQEQSQRAEIDQSLQTHD